MTVFISSWEIALLQLCDLTSVHHSTMVKEFIGGEWRNGHFASRIKRSLMPTAGRRCCSVDQTSLKCFCRFKRPSSWVKKDHLFKGEPWRNGNLGRISALTLEMDELWISKKSQLKLNYSFIYHNHEGDMSGGCHFETEVTRVEDGALSANTNNLHP